MLLLSSTAIAQMLNERAQIVLSVQPLVGEEDRRLVTDALLRLEGVRTAHVDVPRGVVRVDGAASDVELLATMEALGKRAAVVTHVRAAIDFPARAHRAPATLVPLFFYHPRKYIKYIFYHLTAP